MTDREAIKGLQNIVEYWTLNPHEQDCAKTAISALQEREERARGCEFCRTFDFSSAKCEVTTDGTHLCMAATVTTYPKEEQFHFCPMCGRKLKTAMPGDEV